MSAAPESVKQLIDNGYIAGFVTNIGGGILDGLHELSIRVQ